MSAAPPGPTFNACRQQKLQLKSQFLQREGDKKSRRVVFFPGVTGCGGDRVAICVGKKFDSLGAWASVWEGKTKKKPQSPPDFWFVFPGSETHAVQGNKKGLVPCRGDESRFFKILYGGKGTWEGRPKNGAVSRPRWGG